MPGNLDRKLENSVGDASTAQTFSPEFTRVCVTGRPPPQAISRTSVPAARELDQFSTVPTPTEPSSRAQRNSLAWRSYAFAESEITWTASVRSESSARWRRNQARWSRQRSCQGHRRPPDSCTTIYRRVLTWLTGTSRAGRRWIFLDARPGKRPHR